MEDSEGILEVDFFLRREYRRWNYHSKLGERKMFAAHIFGSRAAMTVLSLLLQLVEWVSRDSSLERIVAESCGVRTLR